MMRAGKAAKQRQPGVLVTQYALFTLEECQANKFALSGHSSIDYVHDESSGSPVFSSPAVCVVRDKARVIKFTLQKWGKR